MKVNITNYQNYILILDTDVAFKKRQITRQRHGKRNFYRLSQLTTRTGKAWNTKQTRSLLSLFFFSLSLSFISPSSPLHPHTLFYSSFSYTFLSFFFLLSLCMHLSFPQLRLPLLPPHLPHPSLSPLPFTLTFTFHTFPLPPIPSLHPLLTV